MMVRQWIAGAGLLGVGLLGADPVGPPPAPATELRVLVDSATGAIEIAGAEPVLLDALASRPPDADVWEKAVALHVAPLDSGLPVAGSYAVARGTIAFTPAFPLVPGVLYHATVELNWLRTALRLPLAPAAEQMTPGLLIPRRPVDRRTVVTAVHPSAPVLPANLLRLYVHFSRPMREGDAVGHLRLVDDAGHVVAGAFLDPVLELWDASHRRLTVLLDPGRIKRGLRPNRELGPPLVSGRRYRLLVDSGWRDADGAALAAGFSLEFTAGPAERRALHPSSWRVTRTAKESMEPLLLTSPVVLDHALVPRYVGVVDDTGARVPAHATLDDDDRTIRVSPVRPWSSGFYRVVVANEMEDVAGNSVAAAFDVACGRCADRD